MSLEDLAARVEAAMGPDRDLDRAIMEVVNAAHANAIPLEAVFANPMRYTASLDAAMTLVPENMAWTAGFGQKVATNPMGAAVVGRNARFVGYDANYDVVARGEAATPALALCAAALRATAQTRSAQGE